MCSPSATCNRYLFKSARRKCCRTSSKRVLASSASGKTYSSDDGTRNRRSPSVGSNPDILLMCWSVFAEANS